MVYDLDAQISDPDTSDATREISVALGLDAMAAAYDGDEETAKLLAGE